jgi:hypothetical protein
MTNPKVLLAAPTFSGKNYCFIDWWLNIKQFAYPDLDILLVDNSIGMDNVAYLEKFDIRVLHVEPKNRKTQEYITESQNLIRDVFLDEGYDYLFSLETDCFPERKDVIERLMIHDLDVVSAPYFIGKGEESELLIGALVKSFVAKNALFGINLPLRYAFYLIDGTVKQATNCGIGCTLIKKWVIEKIPFRIEQGNFAHSDSFFYTDLFYNGIPSYLDTGIFCRHENQDWGLIHNVWRETI